MRIVLPDMGRRARVVVAGAHGEPPIVAPELPWWAEARSLVAAAEAAIGSPLRVLRRLSVESGEDGRDSEVTYLFERESGPPAHEPDHPLRSPWARSGWLDRALAWEPVASIASGRAVQDKWWNLSAVVEVPTAGESVWLKAIPAFFADEGRVIELLSGFSVPRLVAADERMALMASIPGEDQWQADDAAVEELVEKLVEIQLWSVDHLDDFLAAGARDRRAEHLAADFAAFIDMPSIAAWAEELGSCGLPVTLLHGDFHPGNARGVRGDLVILDWTDAAVGSPLLDLPPLLARLTPEGASAARELVARIWSRHVSGVDFARAFALADALRAAMDALTFRTFLDNIEPAEQIDHAADLPAALRRLLEATRRLGA